ncbi:hypothetical protein [Poseidonocella sedimentorum]|uniref:Uncharacterized protein n=1 Tax=Poseidonocella sedimentorum TaxID=871652 RepID=A0A1I6EBM4_9RHOB|nr:hypothetical protein [Poseidonocella sedimentorum]SFR15140.1 hypothetical protein SAMN04515673_10987 [Poseidonocella sedimentorum]
MRLLRYGLVVLLAVLLLPWGAYMTEVAAPHATESATAATPAAQATLQTAKRKCRTATLPGAPCGPDIAESARLIPPSPPEMTALRATCDPWPGRSLQHEPPPAPPRLA